MLTVMREMAAPRRLRPRAHARARAARRADADAEQQNALLADVLERALEAGEASVKRGPELLPRAARGRRRRRRRLRGDDRPRRRRRRAARQRARPSSSTTPPRRASRIPSTQSSTYRYCTNFAVTGERPGARAASSPRSRRSATRCSSSATARRSRSTSTPTSPSRRPASSPARARSRASTSPTCTRRSPSATGGRLDGRRRPAAGAAASGRRHRRRACAALFEGSARTSLDGGPTLNPSTYELLAGIHDVPAEEVVVLPNSAERDHGRRARRRAVGEGRPRRRRRARSRPGWPPRSRSTPDRDAADERRGDGATRWTPSAPAASRPPRARTPHGRFAVGDAVGFVDDELVAWGEPARRRCASVLGALAADAELHHLHRGRRRAARTTTRSPRWLPDGVELELERRRPAALVVAAGGGVATGVRARRLRRARRSRADGLRREPRELDRRARCCDAPRALAAPGALGAPLAVGPPTRRRGGRRRSGLDTVGDLLAHLPRDRARRARSATLAPERDARRSSSRSARSRSRPVRRRGHEAAGRGHRRRRDRADEGDVLQPAVARAPVPPGHAAGARTASTRAATASASARTRRPTDGGRRPAARRSPQYPATKGITSTQILALVREHRAAVADVVEPLPRRAAASPSGCPTAPRAARPPRTSADHEAGRRRLAFDELLLDQLVQLRLRARARAPTRRAAPLDEPADADRRAGATSCCRSRRRATRQRAMAERRRRPRAASGRCSGC